MKKKAANAAKKSLDKVQKLINKSAQWTSSDKRVSITDQRFDEDSYYRIEIRQRDDFIKFRADPFTGDGVIQQLHGMNKDNEWQTYAWLILKTAAHIEKGKLIADNKAVTKLLRVLNHEIEYVKDDTFKLKNK